MQMSLAVGGPRGGIRVNKYEFLTCKFSSIK